jgi:DNA-binding transcriptional MerR regulator
MDARITKVEMISMMNNETQTSTQNVELKNKIESIPDKMGFKIGEVAQYVGVKQYVLRYWETEFEALHPKKSSNGQRFYTRKDIETALVIRKLLHEDRFSIEGARAVLKKMRHQAKSSVEAKNSGTKSQMIEIQSSAEELRDRAQQLRTNTSHTVVIQAPAVTLDVHPPRGADIKQVEKAIAQREKEMNTHWAASINYLIEEVRGSRKRLFDGLK